MRECQKTDLGEYRDGLNVQWRQAGIYGKEICYRLKKKKSAFLVKSGFVLAFQRGKDWFGAF